MSPRSKCFETRLQLIHVLVQPRGDTVMSMLALSTHAEDVDSRTRSLAVIYNIHKKTDLRGTSRGP